MATSPYFNQYTYGREQRLTEDLITESIRIHGITLNYLPRTIWNEDVLLGEDPLSRFNTAVGIELWVESNTGFAGQGDFLGKFGVELRDQVTFVMARKRWLQISSEKLLCETGDLYQDESANTGAYANSNAFMLEAGTANGYTITTPRPNEGDLLYFAPGQDLFEIKFVEHEDPFYPHGKKYTYKLVCEKFRYSSEAIVTGNTEIDTAATALNLDLRQTNLLNEDSSTLGDEAGDRITQDVRPEDTSVSANNTFLLDSRKGLVDPSDPNPLSELDMQ